MVITDKKRIEEVLSRGVDTVYPLKEDLEKKLLSGERIRLYQGFDPSRPSLHLGNMVGIMKLRQFQELGHEVIFLVGDFTGMIGDPTDKSATRPRLTRKETRKNSKVWRSQISKFMKVGGKDGAKMLFNSKWLDRISFKDLIEITSSVTVQQLIQRDFFQDRLKSEKPIYLHEFLYPIAQAMDSVNMEVDLEIGGSDQLFNMMMGRHLSKALIDKEKFVLTTSLLADKDGNKIGKTTGNAIFLDVPSAQMYGGIMSFPDEVLLSGFELLTTLSSEEIQKIMQLNPMESKKKLAFEVVKLISGDREATKAQEEFSRVFKEGEAPEEMRQITIPSSSRQSTDLLVETGLVSSKTDAKRMIEQGAVKINGELVNDWRAEVSVSSGDIVQVGKRRFVKIA